ncbi:MAG: hypothetical protein JO282_13495 [Alphaproteobacteria bacterium]|nr:hypothetical protein [Alphaproteobacteria bacterium]
MAQTLMRCLLPGMLVIGQLIGMETAHGAAGSFDPTFGTGGVAVSNLGLSGVNTIRLQSTGDIIVLALAPASNEVFRYTTDGELDTSFGNNGVAVTIGSSMSIAAGDQIVVAGIVTDPNNSQIALEVERLNANGNIDTTFGNNGLALADLGNRSPFNDVVLTEPDGSVLACASLFPVGRGAPSQIALAHFTSSGALDTSFGSGGSVIANPPGACHALALLSNGNILVVAGQGVAEYTSKGSVLPTISAAKIVATEPASGFNVFQSVDGDYLNAFDLFVGEESRGHDSSVEVQRFTETGRPDPTFANPSFHFIPPGGPEIQAMVQGVTVAPNGDIVVAGSQTHFTQPGPITSNGLARLTPAGVLDSTFGNGGLLANVPPTDADFEAVIVQPDGNIVTAGVGGGGLVLRRFLGK